MKSALIPTVAAILAVATTVSLGRWQLHRADEKRALQARYEAVRLEPPARLTDRETNSAGLQFRRLVAEGEFDASGQIYLDNQVENGRAGYYVLTPLKLASGSRYVLVNRGWTERGPQYPLPPQAPVPSGRVTIAGYGALPVKRFLELSATTVQGSVWQNLTFDRYRQATGLPVLSIVLVQSAPDESGLLPVTTQPDFGVAMHEGYAFQWFALSATIVIIYFYLNLRRGKR